MEVPYAPGSLIVLIGSPGAKCVPHKGQTDLLADWRDNGLITASQYDTFTRQDNHPARR
ncbi:hypothetical protein [Streptomyces antioxidans]|uniref:hypothetical protein n=1 Tax=Streptomyces antioxidans TaxID=1507734 RepID=UPI000B025158|nr:hypothetical protein [Streptomyces antioxidans]